MEESAYKNKVRLRGLTENQGFWNPPFTSFEGKLRRVWFV
jgi:hypothetical protein